MQILRKRNFSNNLYDILTLKKIHLTNFAICYIRAIKPNLYEKLTVFSEGLF